MSWQAVGAAQVEGGGFALGDVLHQAVELGGGGLVDAGFVSVRRCAPLKNAEGAEGINVCGVFRSLETDGHMALGTEVVDLIWLNLLNDPLKVAPIAQVAVVQSQASIQLVWILIVVIDPGGVETAGPALDAMYGIALVQSSSAR